MSVVGTRLEFGVKLTADIEGFVGYFHYFHKSIIGRCAGKSHAVFFENFAVIVVELVSVTMTFGYLGFSVSRQSFASLFENARICAQAHSAALVAYIFLIGHKVYYFIFGVLVEFSAGSSRKRAYVAGKLDCHHLHTQTYPETRNTVFEGKPARFYHAFCGAVSESARYYYAVYSVEYLCGGSAGNVLAVHPADIHFNAVCIPSACSASTTDR